MKKVKLQKLVNLSCILLQNVVLYFSLDKSPRKGARKTVEEGKSHFRCFWFLTRTRVYTSAWGVEGATKSDLARLPVLIYQQPRQGTPALPRPVSLLFQGHARPFSAPCLSPESGAWGAFPVDLPHPSPELWFQGQRQPPSPCLQQDSWAFPNEPMLFHCKL